MTTNEAFGTDNSTNDDDNEVIELDVDDVEFVFEDGEDEDEDEDEDEEKDEEDDEE